MTKKKNEKALNEILQRIQEGLRTQDLTQKETGLIIDRFGHGWFEDLGYHRMKFNREPKFDFKQKTKKNPKTKITIQ